LSGSVDDINKSFEPQPKVGASKRDTEKITENIRKEHLKLVTFMVDRLYSKSL